MRLDLLTYLDNQSLLHTLKLKSLKRAGWQRASVDDAESVAAHSWGVAWLALLIKPDNLCLERVLELALIHDLAEIVVGDITPHDGISSADKAERELNAFKSLSRELPQAEHLVAVFIEYQECKTPEAVFVHQCDKLDMWLQAKYYMREYPELELREFIESANNYLRSIATAK
ncbi:MAG: HD domain-containing protein [bacterium]|nr:HD domain-containing protein [bacterium]